MPFDERDFSNAFEIIEGEYVVEQVKIAKELSTEAREDLPKKDFAVPGKEKYPIPDLAHARNALARVSQFGSPEEREMVRKKVYAKYPELKEGFKKEHGGESPTSKENVKKEEQGDIGKTAAIGPGVMDETFDLKKIEQDMGGALRIKYLAAKTRAAGDAGIFRGFSKRKFEKLRTQAKSMGMPVEKWDKEFKAQASKPLPSQPKGPFEATRAQKGEAIGAMAGLVAGTALGAALGPKGERLATGLMGSMLGTIGGLGAGHLMGATADVLSRKTASDNRPEEECRGTYEFLGAVKEGMCATPGKKIRSKGKGRGMAVGKGKGPIGEPKTMGSYSIGGQKIAAGEALAAEELGLTPYAGDTVQHDQQAARNDLVTHTETRTSEHLKEQVNPPKGTDELFEAPKGMKPGFEQKVAEEIHKLSQQMVPYGRAPQMPQGYGQQVVYYPVRKPTWGERASQWMQEHPEAYTIAGGGLGALGGGLIGSQISPEAALAGAGLGAVGGIAAGEVAKGRGQKKRASYEIGGEKIAKDELSNKQLKQLYQNVTHAVKPGPGMRRTMLWDVGDVVGKKKGKEEYKRGAAIVYPTQRGTRARAVKTAQDSPMMQGGDVRYTVGPTPEDVAQYLRTQQTGARAGELAGAGLGGLGGAALGLYGGQALAKGLGGGPASQFLIPAAAAGLGALGGGYAGKQLGGMAGEAAGGALADVQSPAAQVEAPMLTPQRAQAIGQRLAITQAARGGKLPTVAISPG